MVNAGCMKITEQAKKKIKNFVITDQDFKIETSIN